MGGKKVRGIAEELADKKILSQYLEISEDGGSLKAMRSFVPGGKTVYQSRKKPRKGGKEGERDQEKNTNELLSQGPLEYFKRAGVPRMLLRPFCNRGGISRGEDL